MDRNDDLAKDLGAQTVRLSSLLQYFNGGFKAGQHDLIANRVDALHRELQDMRDRVNAWESKGRFANAFFSRDRAETLKGHQSTIQTALEEMQLQEEAGRLLDRLGDGKYGSRGDTLEEIVCFPGTRTSILSSIDDWLKDQSKDSRVMWIGGMAGRGKSTIASTVVHNWKARGSCAIFHFRRGQTVLNSRVVCSLARQLGNSLDPAIRRAVVESIRQNRDIADKRLEEQFETLLVGSLSKLDDHSHPIILVIDGLDESDNGKEATRLIQFIDEFSSSLSPNVKFLLTCRMEGFIPHKLESRGWHKEDLDVSVDVSTDIETLVLEKCKDIRDEHRLPESWPQFEQVALLVKMSEGLFQWIRTVINYIRDGSPVDRLRMLLKYPERWGGLDDLYHQILEKAFHNVELDLERQRLLHSLLGTLVVAPVPVHLESLAGLFESQEFLEGSDLSAIIHFLRNDFLADLTSLIFIPSDPDKPLELMHASIGDLLTNKTRCKQRPYHIDSYQLHRRLAGLCLGHMVKSLKSTCSLSAPWEPTRMASVSAQQKGIGALRYSCLAWSTHFTKGAQCRSSDPTLPTAIMPDFEIFSRQKLLFWLEVLSLIGAIPDALRMAREVHQWLLNIEDCEELKKQASLWHDTHRFVSVFAEPIAYGPQHIYASALPSCPTGTELWRCFAGHATVKTIQGAIAPWSSALWTRSTREEVLQTTFLPDGQRIAVMTSKGNLHFREASAGDMIGKPRNIHGNGITSVTCSSDLGVLAWGCEGGDIRLWDASAGESIGRPLEDHYGSIRALSFSPDGAILASGSDDRTVRLWDVRTGESIGQPLKGHSDAILSVSSSPDGAILASVSEENTIILWNVRAGKRIGQPLEGHSDGIRSISFSPDGTILASGSNDRTIRLWDARTGESIGQPLEGHDDWVLSISFSPDGTVLASGSDDRTIRLWDPHTGESIGEPLEGHHDRILSMSFSPDGTVLASVSEDLTIRLWNVRTGKSIGQPLEGHSDWIRSISFSPDGTVLVSGSDDRTIRLWDTRTGQSVGEPLKGHSDWIRSTAFSPDGSILASGSDDRTIRLWDARAGNRIGQPLEGHSDGIRSISFSPDGTVLASGSNDRTLRLWDARTGESIGQPLEGHDDWILSISFSPDGTVLASGSDDTTIRLWDTRTGQSIGQPLMGHYGWIRSISFSPDNTILASGSNDGTIRLWNAYTGESLRQPLVGHSGSIRSISFSPDGTVLASGSDDKTIRLWNAGSGDSIGEPLECEPGWVNLTPFWHNNTPFIVLYANGACTDG
ncbi:hypothetical protein FRB90_006832 [Tulasnella sp. 427]|nr:hypothetical protein FRB90_006832 [Tulasnella sp. 427]